MKLYYSTTSPYSRKVRLVLCEKGLDSQCEDTIVNPFNTIDSSVENTALFDANPLVRVPTLVLENGESFFDSPVICQYLDTLAKPALIPKETSSRLRVLQWEALADGLTDAAFNLVMERRRPEGEQSPTWITNWSAEINRALLTIENKLSELGDELTLAHLAVASAIAYLDFRLPTTLYESECPQVAVAPNTLSWYESFKTRASMQATQLREPKAT